jgi:hypothetical protein
MSQVLCALIQYTKQQYLDKLHIKQELVLICSGKKLMKRKKIYFVHVLHISSPKL